MKVTDDPISSDKNNSRFGDFLKNKQKEFKSKNSLQWAGAGNSLLRSAPEYQGIASAAIRDFVMVVEQNIQSLHSFTLLRHGIIVAEGGVWSSEDTFMLTLCQYETPFIVTMGFRFAGQLVYHDSRVNVDFGLWKRLN
jgi:hypothetical protein